MKLASFERSFSPAKHGREYLKISFSQKADIQTEAGRFNSNFLIISCISLFGCYLLVLCCELRRVARLQKQEFLTAIISPFLLTAWLFCAKHP